MDETGDEVEAAYRRRGEQLAFLSKAMGPPKVKDQRTAQTIKAVMGAVGPVIAELQATCARLEFRLAQLEARGK